MAGVKSNIGEYSAGPLAGVVYYTGELRYFEKELWNYYEMQAARTDSLKAMTGTMLTRLAHGFYSAPFPQIEVFDAIDTALTTNLRQHLTGRHDFEITAADLSDLVWYFANKHRGSDDLFLLSERYLQTVP
jgi:hypothetical protein